MQKVSRNFIFILAGCFSPKQIQLHVVLLYFVNISLSCLSYCVLCSGRTSQMLCRKHFLSCKTFKWPNLVTITAENTVERSNSHLLLLVSRALFRGFLECKVLSRGRGMLLLFNLGSLSICGFAIHFVDCF